MLNGTQPGDGCGLDGEPRSRGTNTFACSGARMFTQQNLAVSNSGFADARKKRETDPVEAEFYELKACELTFGKWLRQLT